MIQNFGTQGLVTWAKEVCMKFLNKVYFMQKVLKSCIYWTMCLWETQESEFHNTQGI